MRIVNRERSTPIETPHGSLIRPLIDRSTCEVTRCSLAEEILPPGCAVSPHRHEEIEEIYYLLSGRGMMTVGDERSEIGPGDAVYIPRGQTHTLENIGAESIRLLLICGPAFFKDDEISTA